MNTTAASVNKNGALHSVKSTENSRLILALSAIGRDATSVGNWNLIAPYEVFTWIKKQGINGPVFALIALDTHKGTAFNAAISLDSWNADAGYKLLDCIATVPEALRVTGVVAGERLSSGDVLCNYSETKNKLRVVCANLDSLTPISLSGTEFPAEILTVNFEVKETIDKSKVSELNIALSGMSLKKNSDSTDEAAMTVVNSSTAHGTVSIVDGISFSAIELYQGDGIDLIPDSKKAVAISVTDYSSTYGGSVKPSAHRCTCPCSEGY